MGIWEKRLGSLALIEQPVKEKGKKNESKAWRILFKESVAPWCTVRLLLRSRMSLRLTSLEVKKYEFQSRYFVHFRTNTFRKGMNLLIPLSMV